MDQKIEDGLVSTEIPSTNFDMLPSEIELFDKFSDKKKPEPVNNIIPDPKKKIESDKKKDPASTSKSKIERIEKEAKEISKSKEPKKESQNLPSKPSPKIVKEKEEKKIDIPKKVANIKLTEAPLPPRLEPQPQQIVKKAIMKEKGIQTDIINTNRKVSKTDIETPVRDVSGPSFQNRKAKDLGLLTNTNAKIINSRDSTSKEKEKPEIIRSQKVREEKNILVHSEKRIPSKKDLFKDNASEISESIPQPLIKNVKSNPFLDPLKAQIAAKESIIQELNRKLEEAKRKYEDEKTRNRESEKKIKSEIAEIISEKEDKKEKLKYFSKGSQTIILPELINPIPNNVNSNPNTQKNNDDNNKLNNIKEIRNRIKTLSNHDISNLNESETSFPSIKFSKYREIGKEEPEVNNEEEKFSQIYRTISKMVEKNGVHIFLNINEDLDVIFKKIYAIKIDKPNDDKEVGILKMPDIDQFKEIMRKIDKEHEKCGGVGGLCGHLKRFYEKLGWKEEKWGRKVFKVHKRDINKVKIL